MGKSSQDLSASDFKELKKLSPVEEKQKEFANTLLYLICNASEDQTIAFIQSQSISFVLPFNETASLLHFALYRQLSLRCIKLLYPFVPYPHLWSENHKTALHLAADYPQNEVVEYFIQNHLKKFKSFTLSNIVTFYIKIERLDLLKLVFEKLDFGIPLCAITCQHGLTLALNRKDITAVKFFLHFFLPFYKEENLLPAINFLHDFNESVTSCVVGCIFYEEKKSEMELNAKRIAFKLLDLANTTEEVRNIYKEFKKIEWMPFFMNFQILLHAKDKIIELCKSDSYKEDAKDQVFLKIQLSGSIFVDRHFLKYNNIMQNKKTKQCRCLVL